MYTVTMYGNDGKVIKVFDNISLFTTMDHTLSIYRSKKPKEVEKGGYLIHIERVQDCILVATLMGNIVVEPKE